MYQLQYSLKQHTPIIHFQYFLTDASLRCTELKAALDKFIIGDKSNCFSSDKAERLNAATSNYELKNWLKHSTKPTNPSFDYEVEIFLNSTNAKIYDKSQTEKLGFFGNMMNEESFNDKTKYKKAIIVNDLITLKIKSVYTDLLIYIDSVIANFFLLKNFGTRQSKGFGSYYPIEKYDYLIRQDILPYYFDVDENKLKYEKNQKELFYTVFEVINFFYKTLRSGHNVKDNQGNDIFYFKSLMWAFAKSKKEHWDKKSIKNKYKNKLKIIDRQGNIIKRFDDAAVKTMRPNSNNSNFPLGYEDRLPDYLERHLWRDLLGLSSTESASYWKINKSIDLKDSKINRFKSPLIFKPIKIAEKQYRVFFGVPPYIQYQFENGATINGESEILDKIFKVDFKGTSGLKLKYPVKFNYSEFLQYAISTYNSNWVEDINGFRTTNEYKIINNIYEQLKPQVK